MERHLCCWCMQEQVKFISVDWKGNLILLILQKELYIMNQQRFVEIFSSLVVPTCFIGPSLMVISDFVTIALNHNVNPIKHSISDFAFFLLRRDSLLKKIDGISDVYAS
jgi:hypothetical protein